MLQTGGDPSSGISFYVCETLKSRVGGERGAGLEHSGCCEVHHIQDYLLLHNINFNETHALRQAYRCSQFLFVKAVLIKRRYYNCSKTRLCSASAF